MFQRILSRFQKKRNVHLLYSKIVEQARLPEFYLEMGVDDSVDGRFDMILLHMFLVIKRLEEEGDSEQMLQRQLQEVFVTDMDRSLREMGVGDMSVGKQVKKMSVAWFGRSKAYREALEADDDNKLLEEALTRNVFRGEPEESVKQLARYVQHCSSSLRQQNIHDMKAGPDFSSPLAQ